MKRLRFNRRPMVAEQLTTTHWSAGGALYDGHRRDDRSRGVMSAHTIVEREPQPCAGAVDTAQIVARYVLQDVHIMHVRAVWAE